MARSLLAVGLLRRCLQPAIPDQPPAAAVPSLYGGGGGCHIHPSFYNAGLWAVMA